MMNIYIYVPMSLKSIFYLLYPTQSLDIVIIHMSDYQVTMYSDNFKDFFFEMAVISTLQHSNVLQRIKSGYRVSYSEDYHAQ